MLDEKSLRSDLEKTAVEILSQKFWPVADVAAFLGYQVQNVYLILDKQGCHAIRFGGKMQLYAYEVLLLFEQQCGIEFQELADQWFVRFKITPPRRFRQTSFNF